MTRRLPCYRVKIDRDHPSRGNHSRCICSVRSRDQLETFGYWMEIGATRRRVRGLFALDIGVARNLREALEIGLHVAREFLSSGLNTLDAESLEAGNNVPL